MKIETKTETRTIAVPVEHILRMTHSEICLIEKALHSAMDLDDCELDEQERGAIYRFLNKIPRQDPNVQLDDPLSLFQGGV